MDNKTITKKVAFTQSFSLNNNCGAATSNVPFLIDLLGTSGPGPILNNFYISLAQVQQAAFLQFQAIYEEMTIYGVGVKLMFPTAFGGNNAITWQMCKEPTTANDGAVLAGNPAIIERQFGSQTGAIPANNTISRYFTLAADKKRLGIGFSQSNNLTYFGQLTAARPYIQGIVQMAGAVANGNSCGV